MELRLNDFAYDSELPEIVDDRAFIDLVGYYEHNLLSFYHGLH